MSYLLLLIPSDGPTRFFVWIFTGNVTESLNMSLYYLICLSEITTWFVQSIRKHDLQSAKGSKRWRSDDRDHEDCAQTVLYKNPSPSSKFLTNISRTSFLSIFGWPILQKSRGQLCLFILNNVFNHFPDIRCLFTSSPPDVRASI